jgi:CubicO group peptidase (beta-lactamase class C family)
MILLCSSVAALPAGQSAAQKHFPAKGEWARRDPAALGLDKAKLDEAIAFAVENQNQRTKDLAADIPATFPREAPYNNLIGPAQERTGSNGVVIRRGFVAASWGDTDRADMTFSVTKSFLSTTVGVLYDRGLIKDLNARVAPAMPSGVDLFRSEHNAKITWDHLLRQTSDWSGTLWDKPDWADRPEGATMEESKNRKMYEPGTRYKYNDVRVNVLALAALHIAKEPLPQILKTAIMDPIGASDSWHWEGYTNSWVTIDGRKIQSVTGGGHWGGGMFINAWDMARFGYLFLNNGHWGERQLISRKWIGLARTPGVNRTYGFMNWFLNVPERRTDGSERRMYAAGPPTAVAFRGNGENIIYIDWENDMVVVVRWLAVPGNRGGANAFFERVLAAIVR